MEITFPILVLEKDSGDILKFESLDQMQRYLERIDIENDEYAAWDGTGQPVSLRVQEPAWLKVVRASAEVNVPDLGDSLRRFAQLRQVSLTDAEQRLGPLALHEAITSRSGRGRKVGGTSRSGR
jgi:hypothetical protein